MKISAYAASATQLEQSYDAIRESCRRQAIGKVAMTASMTGKLMGDPNAMLRMRQRLEADGIAVFGLVYGIGHPAMASYYAGKSAPPDPLPFYSGVGIASNWRDAAPLPRGWRYAVNEFGYPVFCCACPDEACLEGNARIIRQLAQVFDEIWFDDDFRIDGDQGAGTPTGSTASCYCDRCLAELSARVGRLVTREEVVKDSALHEAFTAMKVDQLTAIWNESCRAGHEVNPKLKMGLMVRWGGEERDGIDFARLRHGFKGDVRLRAGEGHFGVAEYRAPEGPVQSHLSVSHHIGWLPPEVDVLSETTYFDGIRHEDIRKKIALAIAAGVREISYCPCVEGWIGHQDFLEADVPEIAHWSEAFGDRRRLVDPVVILRTPAAGRGACDPVARARDRQIFPLFNLAGIGTVVTRVPSPKPDGVRVVAVTGRAALDFPDEWLRDVTVVFDGAALLEDSPLLRRLGLAKATQGEGGRVAFETQGEWTADGLLFTSPGWVVVPYVWQDIPAGDRNAVLADIRRVVAPLTGAPTLSGDFDVFLAASDIGDAPAILLVNLTQASRRVAVELPDKGVRLRSWDGDPISNDIALEPDAIRLMRVHVDAAAAPRR